MSKKTEADPSGQRGNRNKATRAAHSKLSKAQSAAIDMFMGIPRSIRVNRAESVWIYVLPPSEMEALSEQLSLILDQELETINGRVSAAWWMIDNLERAYRTGAAESIVEFNRMVSIADRAGIKAPSGLALQQVDSGRVTTSAPYRTELQKVYVRTYQTMKGFSNDTTMQIVRVIQDGISAGQSPKQIRDEIRGRFKVAKSRAARIANTEVQWAYNKAKLDAVALAEMDTGLESRVIHISALLPTTRKHHAARHRRIYTPEEQRAWWISGSNLINCKCTARPILVDADGKQLSK